jgi:hypothetical protein
MLTQQQILSEYKKCYADKSRIYMIENYLSTFDATQNNTVAFKLFPKQKELVTAFGKYPRNITTKPRQAGISTTTSAFIACEIALAQKGKPETVLIVANRLDLSKLDLKKIKEFLDQIPRWFWGSDYYGTPEKEAKTIYKLANQTQIELFNGCKVVAVSSGENAARGVSAVSWLIFDEAAFIEKGKTVYSQAAATTATGGRIVMISTPNGKDELYYDIYNKAKKEENDFHLVELKWFQDPRYNKNLKWEKLNKETGKVDIVIEDVISKDGSIEYNPEHWESMESQGYKPSSPWYIKMCNTFNQDRQKIAQELDVSFLGSAGTVVDIDVIEFHKKINNKEHLYIDNFYEEAWIFSEPIEGHRYLMPIDVSTGSGDDSSVIHILDIDAIDDDGLPCIEQVFEYQGKLQGDILGVLADQYGRVYGNALAVIDCVGSSGDACALTMQSLGYPNIYYDDANLKNITSENPKLTQVNDEKRIPGFRAGYLRQQMIMNLEKMLRFNEIRPRSKRFTAELDTFIWKNGRPDHQSSFHDDTITSMAMGLFIYQFTIKRLERVKEKNIAMLKSMIGAQQAVNGVIGEIIFSDKLKKTPLPFYTSSMIDMKQMQQTDPNDTNKMLNKYLNMQMNQFIRR